MMYELDNGITQAIRKLLESVTDSEPVAIYITSKLINRDIQSLNDIAVHEYQTLKKDCTRNRDAFFNQLHKLRNEYYEQRYGQLRLF